MPNLADPYFSQTVTFLCEHNEEGALGIIINRPLAMSMTEVLSQMRLTALDETLAQVPVYSGGPVQQERGFVLHNLPAKWESSMQVADELFLTTSKDVLDAIARGEGPANSLVALGYAGWAAGQLEQEMHDNAWLNCPANAKIIFELAPELRWNAAAESIGIDLQRLSNQTGHA